MGLLQDVADYPTTVDGNDALRPMFDRQPQAFADLPDAFVVIPG